MTRARAIVEALIARPGMTLREVAAAIGEQSRSTAVSAQLSQLAKVGKVRRDSSITTSGGRYWPTDISRQDLRSSYSRTGKRPDRMAKARAERAAKTVRAPVRTVPTPSQPKAATRPETLPRLLPARPKPAPLPDVSVQDFLRKGGRIEYLSPHECSQPLRFDHSQTHVPIGKRRPNTRTRPAVGR